MHKKASRDNGNRHDQDRSKQTVYRTNRSHPDREMIEPTVAAGSASICDFHMTYFEKMDGNYRIICKFLSINLCVWTFPQHIKIRALVKDLIQKQAFCRSRHDAVGPLFRFEDFGDVVGREAPAPDSIECSSDAAHHSVKKATAFGI